MITREQMIDILVYQAACQRALTWVREQTGTPEEMWNTCPHTGWREFILEMCCKITDHSVYNRLKTVIVEELVEKWGEDPLPLFQELLDALATDQAYLYEGAASRIVSYHQENYEALSFEKKIILQVMGNINYDVPYGYVNAYSDSHEGMKAESRRLWVKAFPYETIVPLFKEKGHLR